MTRYKAVLFDFDYTMGDTERGILASIRFAMEQMGLPEPPEEAMRRTIGKTLERTYTDLTGRTDPEEQAAFYRLFNRKAEEVMVASARLYPGTKEVLAWLEGQGIRTGVVTNKNRRRIAAILEREGICPAVLVSAEDAVPKPAPDGILLAAGSLGLSPAEILYVGDSPTDEEAARNAGCGFLAVLTGASEAGEFRPETAVCAGLDDLPGLLTGGRV